MFIDTHTHNLSYICIDINVLGRCKYCFLRNISVIGINTVKINSFKHILLSITIYVWVFLKIRNSYVSDANSRLLLIPNKPFANVENKQNILQGCYWYS